MENKYNYIFCRDDTDYSFHYCSNKWIKKCKGLVKEDKISKEIEIITNHNNRCYMERKRRLSQALCKKKIIQNLPTKYEKKLLIGNPIRVPTKIFIKDITPPRSIHDSDDNFEESNDEQSHTEMQIEFDPLPEPKPDPKTDSKIDIQNIMRKIEEKQKMKRRILEDERKKEKLNKKKTFK
jgi:hypothetical protein